MWWTHQPLLLYFFSTNSWKNNKVLKCSAISCVLLVSVKAKNDTRILDHKLQTMTQHKASKSEQFCRFYLSNLVKKDKNGDFCALLDSKIVVHNLSSCVIKWFDLRWYLNISNERTFKLIISAEIEQRLLSRTRENLAVDRTSCFGELSVCRCWALSGIVHPFSFMLVY